MDGFRGNPGLTALPGANWYAKHAADLTGDEARQELEPVTELRVRIPHHA